MCVHCGVSDSSTSQTASALMYHQRSPVLQLVTMPQTNKSVSAGGGPGQVTAPEQDEASASLDVRSPAAAGGGGVRDELGDAEIIKSPSDPKKYRWDKSCVCVLGVRVALSPIVYRCFSEQVCTNLKKFLEFCHSATGTCS